MRALHLIPILALAACGSDPGALGPGGLCSGELDLRNTAPIAVEQVYISTAGSADWGQDLLAPGTLAPGATQRVRTRPGTAAVRVVFVNGRAAEMPSMNVCGTSALVIQPNSLLAQR